MMALARPSAVIPALRAVSRIAAHSTRATPEDMRTATITATLLALLLAPFVAAPRADAAEDVARAPTTAPAGKTRQREREYDGGVVRTARCMAACHDRGAGRDACLQSCAKRAERVVNAPAPATLEQLSACLDDCYSDPTLRRTDRETCKLTCEQIATLSGPKAR